MIVLVALLAIGLTGIMVLLRRAPLLALFLCSFTVLPYLPMGGTTVRSGLFIAAAACFVLLLIAILSGYALSANLRSPLPAALGAYTIWTYCSSLLNPGLITRDSLTFLTLWTLVLTFFLLGLGLYYRATSDSAEEAGESAVNAIVYCGVLSIIVALIEQVAPYEVHHLFSRVEESWGSRTVISEMLPIERVGSIIGSPNAFGAFLLIPSMATLIRAREQRSWSQFLLLVLLVGGLVLLSNSRGAMLGFLVAFAFFLWDEGQRLVLGLALILGAVFGALGGISLLVESAYIPKYATEAFGDTSLLPSFLAERAYIWVFAVSSALTSAYHALVGYGVSNQFLATEVELRGAHNIVFSSLHFYGLIGLLLVLNVLRSGITLRPPHAGKGRTIAARTAWYAGIGLLAHSLLDDVLLTNVAVMGIYFVLLVPVVAHANACRRIDMAQITDRGCQSPPTTTAR